MKQIMAVIALCTACACALAQKAPEGAPVTLASAVAITAGNDSNTTFVLIDNSVGYVHLYVDATITTGPVYVKAIGALSGNPAASGYYVDSSEQPPVVTITEDTGATASREFDLESVGVVRTTGKKHFRVPRSRFGASYCGVRLSATSATVSLYYLTESR